MVSVPRMLSWVSTKKLLFIGTKCLKSRTILPIRPPEHGSNDHGNPILRSLRSVEPSKGEVVKMVNVKNIGFVLLTRS